MKSVVTKYFVHVNCSPQIIVRLLSEGIKTFSLPAEPSFQAVFPASFCCTLLRSIYFIYISSSSQTFIPRSPWTKSSFSCLAVRGVIRKNIWRGTFWFLEASVIDRDIRWKIAQKFGFGHML